MTKLLRPDAATLPAYRDALERGWSPTTVLPEAMAAHHLAWSATDPAGFLASLHDPEATGAPIPMPDGTTRTRLPGFTCWISDGEFCGAINFRWQPGTSALPPHVLGHIGYIVVPWKRGQGHATRALALLLPLARAQGLDHVILTTKPANTASQRVIQSAGGIPLGSYTEPPEHGAQPALKFRIDLAVIRD